MAKMGGSSKMGLAKKNLDKVYLRGKEDLRSTSRNKPRWDESFFERAKKEEKRGGVKY